MEEDSASFLSTLSSIHTGVQHRGRSSTTSAPLMARAVCAAPRQMIRDRPANELSALCSHGEVRQAFPRRDHPNPPRTPSLPFLRSPPARRTSLMRAAERAHHVTVLEPGEGKKSSCHRTARQREKRRRRGGSLQLSPVEIIIAGAKPGDRSHMRSHPQNTV